MAKRKRKLKGVSKGAPAPVAQAIEHEGGNETQIILDNLDVKRFVDRWVRHYGLDIIGGFNKLWGCYPMMTLTDDGWVAIPRSDGGIPWMLQVHIESDLRLSFLNKLSADNPNIIVEEIEVGGDYIEVDFYLYCHL